jgi:hypothetical protein
MEKNGRELIPQFCGIDFPAARQFKYGKLPDIDTI